MPQALGSLSKLIEVFNDTSLQSLSVERHLKYEWRDLYHAFSGSISNKTWQK
jgi:hypothetical protein